MSRLLSRIRDMRPFSKLFSLLSFNLNDNTRLHGIKKLFRHQMFLPLLSALIVRLAIAPWTEQRWDSYISRLMGAYVFGYGINPLFPERSCSCLPVLNYSYPPIWLLMLLPIFLIWSILTHYQFPSSATSLWATGVTGNNLFESYRSFVPLNLASLDLLLKLPIILSDLAVAYLIWLMAGKTRRAAHISLLGWLFNPYVIMIGTVLGEFDSLAVLFMMLSLYYLQMEKVSLSGMWLGLGFATKLFPAVLLPVFLVYLFWRKRGLAAQYTEAFLITTVALFSTLFAFPYPLEYMSRLLVGRASPTPLPAYPSSSGLSWTTLFGGIPSVFGIPLLIFLAPILVALVILRFRVRLRGRVLSLQVVTAGLLTIYLAYPVVNAQYALWAIPLLALLLAREDIGKWAVAAFSGLPLLMLLTTSNPLYFISPTLIPDVNNYPPASDVVLQLWTFPPQLFTAVTILFTGSVVFLIVKLLWFAPRISGSESLALHQA